MQLWFGRMGDVPGRLWGTWVSRTSSSSCAHCPAGGEELQCCLLQAEASSHPVGRLPSRRKAPARGEPLAWARGASVSSSEEWGQSSPPQYKLSAGILRSGGLFGKRGGGERLAVGAGGALGGVLCLLRRKTPWELTLLPIPRLGKPKPEVEASWPGSGTVRVDVCCRASGLQGGGPDWGPPPAPSPASLPRPQSLHPGLVRGAASRTGKGV